MRLSSSCSKRCLALLPFVSSLSLSLYLSLFRSLTQGPPGSACIPYAGLRGFFCLKSSPSHVVASCAGPRTSAQATANALCPMGQEPVVDSGGTVSWHGMTIGFCCKRCEPMFAALADNEKAKALETVDVTDAGKCTPGIAPH